MAPPINISKLNDFSQTHQIEKTSPRSTHISKILSALAILVFIGFLITVGCASGGLIPWKFAVIPLVLEAVLIIASLTSLHKIKTIRDKKKPLLVSSKTSLNDLASMFLSKNLRKILFPTEDTTSLDPTIWFSKERLQKAFSKEWNPRFWSSNKTLYKHSNYDISLTLQTGNISIFDTDLITLFPNKQSAIINAANTNMSTGGSGTNAALSQAVSQESWENSKEGKIKLNISEVSVGRWIYKDPVDDNILKPTYLFQALGPKPSEYPNTFQAYNALILAYINCLEKADVLEVALLQLPLLSDSGFGSSLRGWPIMIKLAFLAGLSLFLEKKPQSSLKRIILVDPYQTPDFN